MALFRTLVNSDSLATHDTELLSSLSTPIPSPMMAVPEMPSWHLQATSGSLDASANVSIIRGSLAKTVLVGNRSDSWIIGDDGNDLLLGMSGHDLIMGGAGDDALLGDAGSDTLWGNEGSDSLYGGTGQDFLRGGPGTDILTGEADSDVFIWYADDLDGSTDRITDFQLPGSAAMDFIDLTQVSFIPAGQSFEEVIAVRQMGDDTVVGLKTTDSLGQVNIQEFVVIGNISASAITADSFLLPPAS